MLKAINLNHYSSYFLKKHILLLVSISFLFLECTPYETYFEDSLCIENITIIDPQKGQIDNQTLIIQNGKISKIFPSQEINLSRENNIINGTGKYIIPGLWDAHIHFSYIEDLAPHMFNLFLSYGVTSVRDTGGNVHFVKRWKTKALENITGAPRVMIAGPLLDGIPNVYDGSSPNRPPLSVGLKDLKDIEKQIHYLDSLDVDFLKSYEMLSPEQFEKVMELAKEKGLKVTGHIPLSMDVISASNAGLNSMEHLRNIEMSTASDWEELLEERKSMLLNKEELSGGDLRSKIHSAQRTKAIHSYDSLQEQNVLDALSKNDTWQIATLALVEDIRKRPYEDFDALPREFAQDWLEKYEQYSKLPPQAERQAYSIWHFSMIKKIHENNIEIMAGTDTPIGLLVPGRSLHDELRILVEAGLSPLEALKTATYNPAKYFNMENELGSIQEGMIADLVVLNKNPLVNITNTLEIDLVIKSGSIYLKQ
jgi:imidazolonepropionase-like amidohydrolase